MKIKATKARCEGHTLTIEHEGQVVARASLFLIWNSLHNAPYGLMEDVFVEAAHRGNRYGTRLVEEIIALAREKGCYKLIATSRHTRPKVHQLYMALGFQDHGKEFRINFP